MSLTSSQIRFLRSKAHHLKPVILIGNNGFHQAVCDEIDNNLEYHELLKIRIPALDKDQKKQLLQKIATQTESDLIHSIGHIGVFFRKRKKDSAFNTLK